MRHESIAIALAILARFLVVTTASPVSWPEEKLEEINALRAEGVPEVFIVSTVMASLESLADVDSL